MLKELLEQYQIPVDQWGVEDAKSIAQLEKEIECGDCTVEETSDGLRRVVSATVIDVQHEGYRLKEVKQVFYEGTADESTRYRNFNGSVAEKMKTGEDPKDGAIRGLEEELGIVGLDVEKVRVRNEDKVSSSYPGLTTKYTFHDFKTEIDSDLFVPEGYIQKEDNLTIYFEWKNKKESE